MVVYRTIPDLPLFYIAILQVLVGFNTSLFAQELNQYKIQRLANTINSEFEETKPFLSRTGDTLIFIRSHFPENMGGVDAKEDIWFSFREDNKWTQATNQLSQVNNRDANILAGIPLMGSEVFLIDNSQIPGLKVLSVNTRSSQSRVVINTEMVVIDQDEFNDVFLHPNERILLVSMHSMNSVGMEDLYVSLKRENGEWSWPVNLGASINSRGFEISPFLSLDGETLYFASDGHGGFGSADIYKCRKLDDSWKNWSKLEHLKSPFNSPKFDAYLSENTDGSFLISSNRSSQYADIFHITEHQAYDTTASMHTSADLPGDINPSNTNPKDAVGTQIHKSIALFDFNDDILKPDQQKVLERFLVTFISDPQQYRFEVTGYTDPAGTNKYNDKLSLRRSKSVQKFLNKKGISKKYIQCKGAGVFSNSAVGAEEMRRVEINVIPTIQDN